MAIAMDESLNRQVLIRLLAAKPLGDLSLPIRDGRVDLRGFRFEAPKIEDFRWHNLDFSGVDLSALRMLRGDIDNCLFEKCDASEVRMWSTRVSNSSFRGASLREAMLGGADTDGRTNTFHCVDFAKADLRRTVYKAASFESCVFRNSKIADVDFQTTRFSDCRFEGKLERVLFYRYGFKGEQFPPNEMANVDFSNATLRWVEFRGLDLDRVKLPNNSEHLLIQSYPAVLERMIAALQKESDLSSRTLAAVFEDRRKWAGPHQVQGVLNVQDLLEAGGEEGLRRVRELL